MPKPLPLPHNTLVKHLPLKTPIREAFRTTKDRLDLLKELGLFTVQDLLEFYPRAHETQTEVTELHEVRGDEKNLLEGTFTEVRKETTRGGKSIIKALFLNKKGEGIECVWFNQPYIRDTLPLNKPVLVAGKAKIFGGKISLQSPSFERLTDNMVHLGRISPVYREHKKLSSDWFRQKMFYLLDIAAPFPDLIPPEIRAQNGLIPKSQAVQNIHFPENEKLLKKAQDTLGFEELFLLQTAGLLRKKRWQKKTKGHSKKIPLDAELQKRFFDTLPFTLTDGQKITLFEILKDFEGDFPALRLVEGDVGSGKTVVAIAASLPIIKHGFQTAFLAPTEVLANQHFKTVSKLLAAFDPQIKVELLTGAIKGQKRLEILEGMRKGTIHFVIGTHALIQETVVWHDLGLCIIDEQHRFGVEQRETLLKQGYPHVIQMTATPIPRTLAIVAFGDQDLSVIPEVPSGRKKIITRVITPSGRRQIELFVEEEVKKGRQGFIICPLVEGSDNIVAKAATEEFERLRKDVFPSLRLCLLHGKMKSKDKKAIMEAFEKGEYDLLVSTAVVEVGVDVPNATIMLIEGAERFGLAQLHQFRGRVGRGADQSYCFLFPSEDIGATQRLRALEKYDNGFQLAEIDLHLRGAGEVFGIRQSGIPDLKMASLFDARVIAAARAAAEEYVSSHEFAEFPEALREEIERKERDEIRQG